MRRLPNVVALLSFGVGMVVAAPASATGRVAALVPQIRPMAAPEVRDRFHEAVTRGLGSGGDEVVSAAEVRLRLGASEELLGCSGSGACVARATQALRVEHAVATEIDIAGKDYAIKMRLLDAVGRELAKADEPCDICTVKEADEAVVRAATRLAAAARALPPETTPPAAETAPPPKVETPPPAKVETPPPSKIIEVPQTVTTPETTVAEVKPPRSLFPWRPLAITSAAIGAAGLIVGISLLAIDGRPTCNLPNPKTSCPDVYNTVGGGAALLTIGLVAAAGSGVLFYFDHRARKKAQPAVAILPLQGGAYVTAGGRF